MWERRASLEKSKKNSTSLSFHCNWPSSLALSRTFSLSENRRNLTSMCCGWRSMLRQSGGRRVVGVRCTYTHIQHLQHISSLIQIFTGKLPRLPFLPGSPGMPGCPGCPGFPQMPRSPGSPLGAEWKRKAMNEGSWWWKLMGCYPNMSNALPGIGWRKVFLLFMTNNFVYSIYISQEKSPSSSFRRSSAKCSIF